MISQRPVTVRRIDWFRVLADLKRAGMGLRAIAAATSVSKPVLIGLRNNDADPKMNAGETLVALWIRMTGLTLDDLPRWGDEYKPRRASPTKTWERGQIHCPLCGTAHHIRPPKVVALPPDPDKSQIPLAL